MDDLAKLYAVLELHPSATAAEVKAAYLDLVKVWHPDRYQHESPRLREKAEEKLKSINDAYARLRTPMGPHLRRMDKPPEPGKGAPPILTELFARDFGRGWGYVNREGKLLISPRFDSADAFVEGLAHVSEAGHHGFINSQGDYQIHPQYANARNFSEGLAAVVVAVKWGFINHTDQYVVTPLYEECGDFSEGMAAVRWRKRWGYIDRSGAFKISPRFDAALRFVNSEAQVRLGEQWGRVNLSGELYFANPPGVIE